MTTTPATPAYANPTAGVHDSAEDAAQLRRLRWGVRTVLTLGVAASIAANVLHARPNTISQLIAAWPPLALLLTVELISRIPADRRGTAVLRLIAAAIIAGIAAWVSYWHMAGVAARYGETTAAASYLLPVSVDGLVVVASISLVEIAGRIRRPPTPPLPAPSEHATTSRPSADGQPTAGSANPTVAPTTALATRNGAPPATIAAVTATAPANHQTPHTPQRQTADDHARRTGSRTAAGETTVDGLTTGVAVSDDAERTVIELAPARYDRRRPAPTLPPSRDQNHHAGHGVPDTQPVERASDSQATRTGSRMEDLDSSGEVGGHDTDIDQPVPADTAAAVAYWYRREPSLHPADIAARIGRSERTVRRHWPPAPHHR